jgi:predicted methyltransferase
MSGPGGITARRREPLMGFLSVIGAAHGWVRERVQPGDAVVDATLGGGVDARFLAELTGPRGTLIGFDIQPEAIRRTEERLAPLAAADRLPETSLQLRSHAGMAEAVPAILHGRVAAVLFNLGYLPGEGSDQSIVTQPDSTLAAMEAALALLRPGGILACVLYPDHPGGAAEAEAVTAWASALPPAKAQSVLYRMMQKTSAPYAMGIEKRQLN